MVSDAVTWIAKGGSAAVCTPSLTPMTMFEYVPVWLPVGVPDNIPVVPLNVAHTGRFCIEKVSVVPLGALVVGWKE